MTRCSNTARTALACRWVIPAFKHLKLIAGAGVTVERDFDFFRANQSKRTDPAPYVRIAAEVKF